jgi:hypothetical protein
MPAIQFSSNGVNWDTTASGYALGGGVWPVAIEVSESDTTAIAFEGEVIASHEGGRSFPFWSGPNVANVTSVTILQHPITKVWYHIVGNADGVFRSPFVNPQFIKISPASNAATQIATVIGLGLILVSGIYLSGIYYSSACGDAGSWQSLSTGIPSNFYQVHTFGIVGTFLLASLETANGVSTYRIDLSGLIPAPPTPTPGTPPAPTNLREVH